MKKAKTTLTDGDRVETLERMRYPFSKKCSLTANNCCVLANSMAFLVCDREGTTQLRRL